MKKNMKENFCLLEDRLYHALSKTDLEKIRYELKKISEPTLVSGVGGSGIVSNFTSKVLNKANKIITKNVEPRNFKYFDLDGFKNVITCSYSGNNYGVELAFDNNLNHYLLSSNKSTDGNVIPLQYEVGDNKEKSFVSLASTIIPCAILLDYYNYSQSGYYDTYKILDNFESYHESHKYDFDVNCDCFEIFSGLDTSASSTFLESTFIEAGIGVPIVHDKYSYCHGRSTLSMSKNNIAIYFNNGTEFDKLLLEELPKYYKDVIILQPNYLDIFYNGVNDSITNDFRMLNKCLYLVRYIAEKQAKDLSGVDYNPIVKKIYNYNGRI